MLALASCAGSDDRAFDEPVAQRQLKLVHEFSLPIPVGMHPENIVLGATETIHINDRATILDGAQEGNVAALSGQNTTGFDSRLRSIWSGGSLLIRQSVLTGYYKAGGTVSVQQGAPLFFGDPEENRSQVPVRQDPLWTGIVSTTNLTDWFSLEPQQVLQISPGPRGNWSIKSNATLIFNAPGIYHFHGLFLEPNASLILPDNGVTQIIVDDSMILRAPLGNGVDTILGYFGQGSLQVEAPFDGQLIVAPNAPVEIKSNMWGRVFAKRIEVHQSRAVTARPMTDEARAWYMPGETVTALGVMDPNNFTGSELDSAVFPPSFAPQCVVGNPIALVGHHSSSVLRAAVDLTNGSFLNLMQLPGLPLPPNPPACIPTVFPNRSLFEPHLAALQATSVPNPNAPAYYGPGATDNLIARLPGGRALQVGFTDRLCGDPLPPQGTNCPPTKPQTNPPIGCNPTVNPDVCYYGGTTPPSASADQNCLCADADNKPPNTPVWNCRRRRYEGGALAVRMSFDCGGSWNGGVIDLYEMGVMDPSDPSLLLRATDRPELYVDPFDDRVFVSATWLSGFGLPDAHVTVEGRPKSALSAGAINWTVVRNEPRDGVPRVMTTVRDERARLPDPPFFGPFVHFAEARCFGPVKISVTTPFGVRDFDLTAPTNPEQCNTVGKSENGMPFNGIHYGPSITAISSTPPRFLVAYSGRTSTDFEIINVYMVTLKSAGGYAGPHQIELVARLDESASGTHLIFPDLVQPDHLAGSDLGVDTPVILRFASVSGNTVREHAIALYSGLAGPQHDLTNWSLATAYPGKNCAGGDPCFIGDYRYGSLIEKTGGTSKFFMPWIGGDPAGATAGTSVQASVFNVDP